MMLWSFFQLLMQSEKETYRFEGFGFLGLALNYPRSSKNLHPLVNSSRDPISARKNHEEFVGEILLIGVSCSEGVALRVQTLE